MLFHALPGFFPHLEPVPFGHALLHAADKDRGGVDAVNAGGLVGGKQRNALLAQLLFQFQGIEGVAAGALDVLHDHGGKGRLRGAGLVQQVGKSPVAGQAGGGELLIGAVPALFQAQRARLHIPEICHYLPACGQPVGA
jgi:hypothetical protein